MFPFRGDGRIVSTVCLCVCVCCLDFGAVSVVMRLLLALCVYVCVCAAWIGAVSVVMRLLLALCGCGCVCYLDWCCVSGDEIVVSTVWVCVCVLLGLVLCQW